MAWPNPTAEVHVGDIGTEYRVKVTDAGAVFDPSAATVKKLIFARPQGDVVERDATAELVGEDYYLVWKVPASDATFHATAGKMKIQAKLTFADGTIFKSSIQDKDADGNLLMVFANLN